MKRIIMVVAALFLLAGGGGWGPVMLGVVPNPFNSQAAKRTLTTDDPVAGQHSRQKLLSQSEASSVRALIRLDAMIVPVIINGSFRRRIYISARMEAPVDQKAAIRFAHTAYFTMSSVGRQTFVV